MPDYIALYRAYLEQEKHASPNTVSSYVRDLTQFRAWLPQGSDLRRVKPAAVEEYLAHLTDQGRAAAPGQAKIRAQIAPACRARAGPASRA